MNDFYSFFRIFGYPLADNLVMLLLFGCFLFALYFDDDFSLLAKRLILIASIILIYLVALMHVPYLFFVHLKLAEYFFDYYYVDPGAAEYLGFFLSVIVFLVLVLFYKTRSFIRKQKLITLASFAAYLSIGLVSLLPVYNLHGGGFIAPLHGHSILSSLYMHLH